MLNFPNIDPVILPVGPLAITWYSLSYVVGIMIGWHYILRLVDFNSRNSSHKSSAPKTIAKPHIDDFVTWAIIVIVLGGRLGYVLFYKPAKYFADPILIFKTYEGGMSFHGGLIGYISASFLFARRNKIPFLELIDLSAAAAPIALFLGRIANFINAELYGRVTDVPWAFIFPGSDGQLRHPSQLYEAFLEGFVLFFILGFAAYRHNGLARRGFISGLFLVFYTIFRFIVEFFREPDAQIGFIFGSFTMGQLLSIPMILGGLFLIFYSKKHVHKI
ncbi:MAG: prolipoprotein diacylglyceryl transferase [Rickettsiaceae bacterium]|nr:prolipoprotein diacylglyceryl transferase [Rickettsiaceae bacterium]